MQKVKEFLTSEKTYIFLLSATLISIPLPFAYSTASFLCLLAVSLASLKYHKPNIKQAYWVPALFFVFMVCSLLWTINTGKTFKGLERQLLFLLVPIAFSTMPLLSRSVFTASMKWFSYAMSILGLFFMINALALYFINGTSHQFFYHGLVLPLELNAIYVAVFTALSLLFVIFYGKGMWGRVAVIFSLGLFLILLSSKIIIPATALAIIVGYSVKHGLNKKKAYVIALAVVVLGIALFVSPLRQRVENELESNLTEVLEGDSFEADYPWTGTTIRLFQARLFSELLEENDIFLLGFGMNASQEKLVEKQKQYNLYFGYREYNFHNQYLQVFSELGIVGLLFIFTMLGITLRQYFRTKEPLALGFFIIMTAVLITESLLWRHRGMLFFLLLYCILFQFQGTQKQVGK